jgi:hypothetical protein
LLRRRWQRRLLLLLLLGALMLPLFISYRAGQPEKPAEGPAPVGSDQQAP